MSAPNDPFAPDGASAELVVTVESSRFSRAQVATTRRGIDDLRSGIDRIERTLLDQSYDASDAGVHDSFMKFQQARKLKAELNRALEQTEAMLPTHGNAKLTEEEKRQIRGLYSTGLYTQEQLARQYGVTQPTISDVVNGRA